ncbi:CsbD family protein [Stieleria varia]|uniref:CsbD-like domain-containing protein n=1 Tax=Stieleria varia TaxID=2528005 RepID=A0A5C6AUA8_9BACT|nr:hypothetical protein Pla52n_36480 [Stieleria varia]
MATKQEMSGNWKQFAGKVKEKYGQVTDDDLSRAEGNIDQLVGVVQEKTGQTREQIEAFFEECSEACGSMMDRASEYASAAGDTLKEGYDAVSEQARRGYNASVKTLSRHPLESVGTAFGVGLLAGLLIGVAMGAQRERELSWRERWMR